MTAARTARLVQMMASQGCTGAVERLRDAVERAGGGDGVGDADEREGRRLRHPPPAPGEGAEAGARRHQAADLGEAVELRILDRLGRHAGAERGGVAAEGLRIPPALRVSATSRSKPQAARGR
jgi:hypothetical protein